MKTVSALAMQIECGDTLVLPDGTRFGVREILDLPDVEVILFSDCLLAEALSENRVITFGPYAIVDVLLED